MQKRSTEALDRGVLAESRCGPAGAGTLPEARMFREQLFQFGGMNLSDAKRLKELEIDNNRVKKLLADELPENEVTPA